MSGAHSRKEPTQHRAIIEMGRSWRLARSSDWHAPIESALVKTTLTTWLLLFGLLLQSVAWALPAQRQGQAERLAHQVAHALDHGHHQHGDHGHDPDDNLQLSPTADTGNHGHGPHHSHASEGVQFQGLPVAAALQVLTLPRSAPRVWTALQPPSAHLAGLLRPPQTWV